MPGKAALGKSAPMNPDLYRCQGCGRLFSKQRVNFPVVGSHLYAGNNHYLSWCSRCIETYLKQYMDDLGMTEAQAIKRLCSKFDIYWNEQIYNALPTPSPNTPSRLRAYISKTNLAQYAGKTFDDTLIEEGILKKERVLPDMEELDRGKKITPDMVRFWGKGRDPGDYIELQDRYDNLASEYTVDTPASKILLKQACLSEYEIDQLQLAGKSFEKQQASLVNTLGSLNLKPSQIKKDEENSGLENLTLGVGIQHWEYTRPIPEPDPSWCDVDGIIKYVITWFMGTLCNMLGIENKYNKYFQEELSKLRVHHQEYEDEEDEEIITDIIKNDGGDM